MVRRLAAGTRLRSRSFESAGVAIESDDVGVVDEQFDHGDDDDAEDLAPVAEGFVAGGNQAGAFGGGTG
jgi:hypothetical protein